MFPRSVETGNHNFTGSQTYTHTEFALKPTGKLASTQVSCLLKSSGHGGQLTPFSSLLPAEPRAGGTQSSSTHGRGHWTASLEDILSSTISSPSWNQPLRLGGRSPISQIHSHHDPSLMPQHWGARAVASNLSPTCCHLPAQVLCLSSSELQPGQDPEGKWVEPGSILCTPQF